MSRASAVLAAAAAVLAGALGAAASTSAAAAHAPPRAAARTPRPPPPTSPRRPSAPPSAASSTSSAAATASPRCSPPARLRAAAAAHSADMVARGFFDHVSPDGGTLSDRARRTGYGGRTLGEDIGWGTYDLGTPSAIVAAWMKSPPHRAIILGGQVPRDRRRRRDRHARATAPRRAPSTCSTSAGADAARRAARTARRPLQRANGGLPDRRTAAADARDRSSQSPRPLHGDRAGKRRHAIGTGQGPPRSGARGRGAPRHAVARRCAGDGMSVHALGGERLAGAERALRAALSRERRTRAPRPARAALQSRASTRPPTATAPTWSRATTSPT